MCNLVIRIFTTYRIVGSSYHKGEAAALPWPLLGTPMMITFPSGKRAWSHQCRSLLPPIDTLNPREFISTCRPLGYNKMSDEERKEWERMMRVHPDPARSEVRAPVSFHSPHRTGRSSRLAESPAHLVQGCTAHSQTKLMNADGQLHNDRVGTVTHTHLSAYELSRIEPN
ncbi:hypothetical protein EVAR_96227_1 [Eumeta japonica]|uniref:Uncharacterized protein n=1 Tax=Eumeta variegata TaxID=151549 RepID=A0A4C1WK54_EUMVA|nr:hypothetical protein EVAR_96227_1 [Eumeta japonica]